MKISNKLYAIIKLFHKNNLAYNLFKCEHILDGTNANLDILFLTAKDYQKASKILEKQGFILYLPEKIEKYKKMYVKFEQNQLFAIHLHREIAWHNLKILDKEQIFKRQKKITKEIIIPSDEDSLIIHSAHIIFENYIIKEYERNILVNLLKKKLDKGYINNTVRKSGFKKTFDHIIKTTIKNQQPRKRKLQLQLIKKLIKTPIAWPSTSVKALRFLLRKTSLKRKGCLIALIGVNGSGKTTLARKTLEQYKPLSSFFNGQFGYYFGWEPYSWYTKMISKAMKKKNRKVFQEMNKKEKRSIFKELVFIYNYLEYLHRYLFVIYPKLRKNKLVITDRYFYDIYGQYTYAPKSTILKSLFSIYPKPDYLFVLHATAKTVRTRDKETRIFSKLKKSSKRESININILQSQIDRYKYLNMYLHGELLNTESNIQENIKQIMEKTWKTLAK